MIAGRVSTLFGACLGFAFLFSGWLSPVTLACSVVFVGFGNGLTMPSSNTGVMSVRPKISGSAAGFSGAMVVGMGALLSSIAAVVVTPEDGAFRMFAMILVTALIGMGAALFVRHMDRVRASDAAT